MVLLYGMQQNFPAMQAINVIVLSLLLLYLGEVKKFKVILKAKSAMTRLVRMCLAQSGYGSVRLWLRAVTSGLLPPKYMSIEFYFTSTFT